MKVNADIHLLNCIGSHSLNIHSLENIEIVAKLILVYRKLKFKLLVFIFILFFSPDRGGRADSERERPV